MSDMTFTEAGIETRRAMLRVWMAISAVWVAFWLVIATIIVMTGAFANPLFARLDLVVLIVVLPPVAMLAIGTLLRCAFEALAWKLRAR